MVSSAFRRISGAIGRGTGGLSLKLTFTAPHIAKNGDIGPTDYV